MGGRRGVVGLVLVWASVALADPHGQGGGPEPTPPAESQCIPATDVAAIRAMIPAGAGPSRAPQLTTFADPMGAGGMNSFGKTITNYVDLNASTGILDWNCGAVTYDGHTGNDIEIRDFYDMDEGVPVLAAAPGTVVHTHDGEFDRRTVWQSGVTANDVIVQHADGSQAWYWHFKRGSVRVSVGQPVAVGDTLGLVGSSGFSSGPHLHFEVQEGGVRDPFSGSCQPSPTRWNSQQPYVFTYPREVFNSGISTIPLDWSTICERPPVKTHVRSGSTLYHWFRIRNLLAGQTLEARIYSPLGLWGQGSFPANGTYASSWWYLYWTLPTDPALFGAWHSDLYVNGALVASYPYTLDAAVNALPTIASRTENVVPNGSRDVDLAGADPDGSVFRHEVLAGPFHGTATAMHARARVLRYAPANGFTGEDSVTVRAVDDENVPGPTAVIRFHVAPATAVGGPGAGRLALSRVAPDPVRADSRVGFVLPAAGVATIEVLDASGRRQARWSAALGAGSHEVAWRDLMADSRLAPGLYFVRLAAGGGRVARRAIVTE